MKAEPHVGPASHLARAGARGSVALHPPGAAGTTIAPASSRGGGTQRGLPV